ncbi:unnamed protein product [Heligmosomoides polygyrus]|uniref:Uncharacterized protein n=1 Tax=Heligmosomoides polygyrus TaxID=6339 RepID=A0A3P8B9N8_HELPZ|nr:unnamed protein product [Heligmosomoides polygyrus]
MQRTHKELLRKLEDLQKAARILDKHGDELIRCVNEPEIDRKTLTERAALLKITTAAVLKAAEEFVDLSDRGSRRMGKVVATERREKLMLQEQLETLAKQHSSLERAATLTDNISFNPPLSAYSDMEDEFHDAAEELSISGSRVSLMEGATTVKGFAILKPLLHYFFPSQESLCEDYLLSTTSDAVESKLHYDPSVFRIQLHSF